MKRLYCPNCKCSGLTLRSRRKYFLRLTAGLAALVFSSSMIYSLWGEDVNAVVMLGLILSGLLICVSIAALIGSLIRFVRLKKPYYYCPCCKTKIYSGVIAKEIDDEALLIELQKVG